MSTHAAASRSKPYSSEQGDPDLDHFANRLYTLPTQDGCRAIHFAGLRPLQGTSTVVVRVAEKLSSFGSGSRILVVDAHPANAALHEKLGVHQGPGLMDFLVHGCPLQTIVQRVQPSSVDFIGSGEAFRGVPHWNQIQHLLGWAAERYALVLLDSAPITDVGNSYPIARLCAATVLVVSAGSMHHMAARSSLAHLREAGISVMGMILTRYRREIPGWIYRRV